ncbi:MAG: Arm DNA-binding domain-containing protein [Xanthobacteraceae bacterium]
MRNKITKRVVDQVRPGQLLWDTQIKGFGVRCRQSGSKHYFLKTRAGGRQRWLTIGRHGSPWTPDAARNEALRLLSLKAAGKSCRRARPPQRRAYSGGTWNPLSQRLRRAEVSPS